MKNGKKDPTNPSKKAEFEAFIQLIRGDTVAHWVQIAQVLGVNRTTIAEWKKHPLAQKAIKDGVEKALSGMETAGKKDWKMWESKAKMLGISPIEKQDITSDGEKVSPILGGITKNGKIQSNNSDEEAGKTSEEN